VLVSTTNFLKNDDISDGSVAVANQYQWRWTITKETAEDKRWGVTSSSDQCKLAR
jgi:hypothetical protein